MRNILVLALISWGISDCDGAFLNRVGRFTSGGCGKLETTTRATRVSLTGLPATTRSIKLVMLKFPFKRES